MNSKKLNDLATKNLKNRFNDNLSPVKSIFYEKMNKLLFSGSKDGLVRIWKEDIEENLTNRGTFQVPKGSHVSNLHYSSKLKLLFTTGGSNGDVVVWKEEKHLEFNPSLVISCGAEVNSLLVTDYPPLMFVGTKQGTMKVYEIEYDTKGGLI